MMRLFFIFLALSLVISFDSSFGMARKSSKDERIRQGVYGTKLALDSSRVDLADSIITDTTRLVPPPKKPLEVKEFSKTTVDRSGVKTQTKYVVLPAAMNGPVVRKDSAEFNELMKDRQLLKQYQDGEKKWRKYSNDVSRTLQEIDEAQIRLKELNAKLEKENAKLKAFRGFIVKIIIGAGAGIGIIVLLWVFLKMFGITMRAAF